MSDIAFAITLDDGRTIIAQPGPDSGYSASAALGDELTLRPTDGGPDTAGHASSADVYVDVEGHAMTLRLPNTADAAALRRALVAGMVTATIVAAGAVAAMQTPQPTAGTTGAENPVPVQNYDRHGSHPE